MLSFFSFSHLDVSVERRVPTVLLIAAVSFEIRANSSLLFCDQVGVRSMVYLALEAALSHLLLSHRLNQSNSWKHRRVAFRMRNISSKIALSRCTVACYSVHLRNFHFVPIFMQSFSVFNELREFTRALSQLPH